MKKIFNKLLKKVGVKTLRIATNGNTYITITFTLFLLLPGLLPNGLNIVAYGATVPAMVFAMVYTVVRRELKLQTHQVGVYLTITGMKYYLLSLPGQAFTGASMDLNLQLLILGISLAFAGMYFIHTSVKDFKAIKGTAVLGMGGLLYTVTKFIF